MTDMMDDQPTETPIAPVPETSHRVWTVFATMGATLALVLFTQIALGIGAVIWLITHGTPLDKLATAIQPFLATPSMFILLIIVGPGTFGLAAALAAWFSPVPWGLRLRFVPVKQPLWFCALLIFGSLFPTAIGIGMAEGLVKLWPNIPIDATAGEAIQNLTFGWWILFVILIGLIPGFAEEMLFRGYIQSRFVSRFGPIIGIGVTSILFGLAHVMPAAVVMATFIGLYLGIVAWKTGSIWPTIGAHIFINSSINLYRMVIKFAELSESIQQSVMIATVSLSAICCLVALWMLFRPTRRSVAPSTDVLERNVVNVNQAIENQS